MNSNNIDNQRYWFNILGRGWDYACETINYRAQKGSEWVTQVVFHGPKSYFGLEPTADEMKSKATQLPPLQPPPAADRAGDLENEAHESESNLPSSITDVIKYTLGLSQDKRNPIIALVLSNLDKLLAVLQTTKDAPQSDDTLLQAFQITEEHIAFFQELKNAFIAYKNNDKAPLSKLLHVKIDAGLGVDLNFLNKIFPEKTAVEKSSAYKEFDRFDKEFLPDPVHAIPCDPQGDFQRNMKVFIDKALYSGIMKVIYEKIFRLDPPGAQFYNAFMKDIHGGEGSDEEEMLQRKMEKTLIMEAFCQRLPMPSLGRVIFNTLHWFLQPWIEGTLKRAAGFFENFINNPDKILDQQHQELNRLATYFQNFNTEKNHYFTPPLDQNHRTPEDWQLLFYDFIYVRLTQDEDKLWKVFNKFIVNQFIPATRIDTLFISPVRIIHESFKTNRVYKIFYEYFLKWTIEKPYTHVVSPLLSFISWPFNKLASFVVRQIALIILNRTKLIQSPVEEGLSSLKNNIPTSFTLAFDKCLLQLLRDIHVSLEKSDIETDKAGDALDEKTKTRIKRLTPFIEREVHANIISGIRVLEVADCINREMLDNTTNSLTNRGISVIEAAALQPALVAASKEIAAIGIQMVMKPDYLYRIGTLFTDLCNQSFEYTPEGENPILQNGGVSVEQANANIKIKIEGEIKEIVTKVVNDSLDTLFANESVEAQKDLQKALSVAKNEANDLFDALEEKNAAIQTHVQTLLSERGDKANASEELSAALTESISSVVTYKHKAEKFWRSTDSNPLINKISSSLKDEIGTGLAEIIKVLNAKTQNLNNCRTMALEVQAYNRFAQKTERLHEKIQDALRQAPDTSSSEFLSELSIMLHTTIRGELNQIPHPQEFLPIFNAMAKKAEDLLNLSRQCEQNEVFTENMIALQTKLLDAKNLQNRCNVLQNYIAQSYQLISLTSGPGPAATDLSLLDNQLRDLKRDLQDVESVDVHSVFQQIENAIDQYGSYLREARAPSAFRASRNSWSSWFSISASETEPDQIKERYWRQIHHSLEKLPQKIKDAGIATKKKLEEGKILLRQDIRRLLDLSSHIINAKSIFGDDSTLNNELNRRLLHLIQEVELLSTTRPINEQAIDLQQQIDSLQAMQAKAQADIAENLNTISERVVQICDASHTSIAQNAQIIRQRLQNMQNELASLRQENERVGLMHRFVPPLWIGGIFKSMIKPWVSQRLEFYLNRVISVAHNETHYRLMLQRLFLIPIASYYNEGNRCELTENERRALCRQRLRK